MSESALLVLCGVLSLPAGWFAGVLYDRVPDDLPLFRPLPKPRVTGVYLALHLTMLAVFLLAARRFADAHGLELADYLLLFTALVALSFIDLETLRLPDKIVAPLLVISIPLIAITSLLQDDAPRIRYAIVGGAFYFVFLLVVHLIIPRGMGFGDVKLAAVMGMYVGWLAPSVVGAISLTLYAMMIGFLVGSFAGLVVFAFRRKSRAIPFGPFLAFGTIVVIIFSQQLVRPY
jgi:leader peptidase (prepilin peptidase) / N-methyltransferase